MATMKAFGITQYGGAHNIDLLTVPRPTPTGREILVKNLAVSLNPVDYKVRENFGDKSAAVGDSPRIMGYDSAGVVEEVGPEASVFKVGDEVYFAGVLNRSGSNAEYTVVDERIVGFKPKTQSFEDASAFPLTALTAWEGLVESLNIPVPSSPAEGQKKTLLVINGAGGVGSLVIQIAKKVLHIETVIATASRPESVDWCKKLGADHVINHRNTLSTELKHIGFSGVDYIFECFDLNHYWTAIGEIINPLARIVSINNAHGALDLSALFAKRATFSYEFMFTRPLFGFEMEKQHAILNRVAELTDAGVIVCTKTASSPLTLANLRKAHQQQESATLIGKAVLVVDSQSFL
eukprot:GILK01001833.1.p1 GENE.GILK01001833.1~~GILK01001833.1.p1  ORF type:complete len:350 (+),score=52.94 GILK01001833.1:90-1139(+)